MRLALLMLALVPLTGAGDGPKEDRDRMQGIWTVTKCLVGGREVASPGGPFLLTFEKDTMRVTRDGTPAAQGTTFKLDPSKAPRAIDLSSEGFEAKGIYEFDGKKLRICYNTKERPTTFDSEERPEEPRNVLFELERE